MSFPFPYCSSVSSLCACCNNARSDTYRCTGVAFGLHSRHSRAIRRSHRDTCPPFPVVRIAELWPERSLKHVESKASLCLVRFSARSSPRGVGLSPSFVVLAALPIIAAGPVSSAPPSLTPTDTPQPSRTPPAVSPLSQPGQQVTLSGRISILYGDPVSGHTAGAANQQGTMRYYLALPGRLPQLVELTTDAQSALSKGGLSSLAGRNVNLRGITIGPRVSGGAPRVTVRAIAAATASATALTYAAADAPDDSPVTKPWLVVGCKFADVATETDTPSYFSELVSETYPFLGDYWERVSYNQIKLTGSIGADSWYTMPGNRSTYYDTNGNAETGKLYSDCAAVGTTSGDQNNRITVGGNQVNVSAHYGVIMLFNADVDSCPVSPAMGPCNNYGQHLDANHAAAWITPGTSHSQHEVRHEMGHGFALPH